MKSKTRLLTNDLKLLKGNINFYPNKEKVKVYEDGKIVGFCSHDTFEEFKQVNHAN